MCALVTGVQTCALPISSIISHRCAGSSHRCCLANSLAVACRLSGCDRTALRAPRGPKKTSQETCAVRVRRRIGVAPSPRRHRSEEHTSELQSLMRISYAVFCLKKKKKTKNKTEQYV